MFEPRAEEPVTTGVAARSRLWRLQAARLDAAEAGLGANAEAIRSLGNGRAHGKLVITA